MGRLEKDALKKMMGFNRQFMETNQAPELQEITEFMRTITGAEYAILNLLDDSRLDVVTEAVAGAPAYLMKITKILGFSLVGKRWPYDQARKAAIDSNNLTTFENLHSSMGNVLPSALVTLIEKTLNIGQVAIIKFNKLDQIIGEFTLLMPRNQSLTQPELADLFASQVGLFLDRMKYQLELQRERQHLSDVIEATHSGAWEYNVQTGDNSYNERWTEILGYTLIEMEPTKVNSWIHLVHPDDYPRASLIFEEAIATGTTYTVEFRMKHKDGHWVWVEDRGKLVSRTSEGKPLMMRGTRTDITKRKMAEEKLMEFSRLLEQKNQELEIAVLQAQSANEAKSRYLAHMNHEIRTPLNGFMGFLQMMEGTRLDEEQQEFMHHMKLSTSHILSIINNVLDHAKIEAGEMQLIRKPFNIEDEIQTALASLRSLALEKNIDLELKMDTKLPRHVEGDSGRFRQIILNLGSNAIKFTQEGKVTFTLTCLKTTSTHHLLQLVVEDTGTGMTPEALTKIFKPFYQADDGLATQSKGTGLGMSITRDLVELMDGEIQVSSTLGEGTRVEVIVKVFSLNQ